MASPPGDDRTISARGLELLLGRLGPDTDLAAAEYERLYRTLVRFFDWRGMWPPDECADETLDRLARKLETGTTVEDLRSYAYGIARMVLLERRRRPTLDPIEEARYATAAPVTPPGDERASERVCMDRCLAEMPAEIQATLLRYYEGEGHVKIANRRRLADSLGLSDGALRSRVQRLRDRLERCIEKCTALRDVTR